MESRLRPKVGRPRRRCLRERRLLWRHTHEVALEAAGSDRAQTGGQLQAYGAADSQGDPGGGLPRPVRRGGGDDTKEAGGERASGEYLAGGARRGAVAGYFLSG